MKLKIRWGRVVVVVAAMIALAIVTTQVMPTAAAVLVCFVVGWVVGLTSGLAEWDWS